MTAPQSISLVGSVGSPYTRKMVALLRYRHIPYQVLWGDPNQLLDNMGIARPKVSLLPTFLLPDDRAQLQAVCDSTPIIRRLEAAYSQRSVIPSDPVVRFIDYLLEDFADEWCSKYMFHYRWHAEEDADNAGMLLPLMHQRSISADSLMQFSQYISQRQRARLCVVGSNDTTAPMIGASYQRLLAALENHFALQPFLLGQRPSAADFALYGQLTQLVGFDPTPREIAHRLSPRTVAYTGVMEDQSGLHPLHEDWCSAEAIGSSLKAILDEVGLVYVPALLANAKALTSGEKTWEAQIDGGRWVQQTFSYQGKCLQWIHTEYQSLAEVDRARLHKVIAGTGCENLF